MKLKFLALTISFLLVSLAGTYAITVLPISEEELTKRATVIVTGEVEEVSSGFDENQNTIYTYIKTRVTRVLKGELLDDYITLRQVGGTVGDQSIMVPGAPVYELGDEILVFAGPLGQTGYYGVLGIYYGRYQIELDPSTGKKYASGASFGIVHTDPETFEPLPERNRPDMVYLDDFLSEIQEYLEHN
jgi:hypothetical protein